MKPMPLDPHNDEAQTKKLLRFGTDRPQCATCKTTDWRMLGKPGAKGSSKRIAMCGNCRAKRKPFSAKAAKQKAQHFEKAGYFKPACIICEHPMLRMLNLDHLANAANSGLVEPLCENHHAVKSYMAETGPMAPLRLRDPNRSALVLEAAFEFGLAAVLGMMAVFDGTEHAARAAFFGAVAIVLAAWALWNLKADEHFENLLGPGYDRAIVAEVPR